MGLFITTFSRILVSILCPLLRSSPPPFLLLTSVLLFASLKTHYCIRFSLALTAGPLLHHGSLRRRTDHFGVNSWRENRFDSWYLLYPGSFGLHFTHLILHRG